jgi:hypothetical protein
LSPHFCRWAECGRKLCHPNYLSAMCHASRLSDQDTLGIYGCPWCGGIHVGHLKSRNKRAARALPTQEVSQSKQHNPPRMVHDLAWSMARIKRRIARKEAAIASFTNPRPKTIRRHTDSLRDMRRHLASLETQTTVSSNPCCAPGPYADISQSNPENREITIFGHSFPWLYKFFSRTSPAIN